jgi:hypothetical protein
MEEKKMKKKYIITWITGHYTHNWGSPKKAISLNRKLGIISEIDEEDSEGFNLFNTKEIRANNLKEIKTEVDLVVDGGVFSVTDSKGKVIMTEETKWTEKKQMNY